MTKPNTPHDSSEPVVEQWMIDANSEISALVKEALSFSPDACMKLKPQIALEIIARHYAARQPDSGEREYHVEWEHGSMGTGRNTRQSFDSDAAALAFCESTDNVITCCDLDWKRIYPKPEPSASPAGDEKSLASEAWNDFMIAANNWPHQYMDKERFYEAFAHVTAQLRQQLHTYAEERKQAKKELAEAKFSPAGDNHHNAAKCPYCNPEYQLRQELEAAQYWRGVYRAALIEAEAALAQAGEQALRDAASDTIKLRKYGIGEPTRISVRTWLTERADTLAARPKTKEPKE